MTYASIGIPKYAKIPCSKSLPEPFEGFTVKHYAGIVEYNTKGWLDKSLDVSLSPAVLAVLCIYIWHSPGQPHPPPPGMVMVPCPAPCGSGWGGCGWVGMLVDGVGVFANDVESYCFCKELY